MTTGQKETPHFRCGFTFFWIIISILYSAVFITIEFAGSPISGIRGFITLALQWAVVSTATSFLLGLISINKYVFVVLFPALMAASSAAAYYKLSMGVSLTPATLELAAVNTWQTWTSVISAVFIFLIAVSAAIGISIVVFRFRHVNQPPHAWIWVLTFAIGIFLLLSVIAKFRAPISCRMPYSFYYSVRDYLNNKASISYKRDAFATTYSSCRSDSINVIVVIGESLRPDHIGFNGYYRNTTPLLGIEENLVSFPKMTTDECFTHVSVPRIVTRADRSNPERAYEEESFITLFNRAGFKSIWISNQDAVETYAYFMHETDELKMVNSGKTFYDYDKWTDDDILPAFDLFICKDAPKKIAVLHTIGSHWWYRSHYSDSLSVYKPEIDSRILSELEHEQIVNSYDNTIIATDRFLSSVIDRIRTMNAVMIYISDHGEMMGENGRYLHAEVSEELKKTACFIWYSDKFKLSYPKKVSALGLNAVRDFSTDNIFHTVLDAGDIETSVKDINKSMFRPNNHD